MEESYFASVKLIYTIGYSISLVVLAVAVLILLLFRYKPKILISISLFVSKKHILGDISNGNNSSKFR